jgi:hypothetical protein
MAVGWEPYDADRLTSGPSGHTGSALQIRRFLRTYGGLPAREREKFQQRVSAEEAGFDVNREELLTLTNADLERVREAQPLGASDSDALWGIYSELGLMERKRSLRWIIGNEPLAFEKART